MIRKAAAAALTGRAANLENVGEVGIEADVERDVDCLQPVIDQGYVFEARVAPQEARADKMKSATMNGEFGVAEDVEVGKIGGEEKVVRGDCGTQQERARIPEMERELG